jgi:hypothetical protein
MALGAKPTVIPRYLSAPTLDELGQLFLVNNLSRNIQFQYFDIQFVNKEWIAFYFDDVETEILMESMTPKNGGE